MGETIVVGVDGSACSLDALRWAIDEARTRGARIVALHAWHVPSASLPMGFPMYAVPRERIEEEAKQVLEASVATVGRPHDVEITTELVEAHPVDALITLGTEADLLVVGSRGLGGLKRALLGSVSQRCAQHAPCPLVIVPARDEAGAPA